MACGCASAPPARAPAPTPVVIGEAEINLLADLLRREDNRQYDGTAFQGFLGNPSETVRLLSVRALGRIGQVAAAPQLIHMLNDPSQRVRAEAAFALGELGDSSAAVVNALAPLTQGNGEAAAEAVGALGKLRTAAARVQVERVLAQGGAPTVVQEALLSIWRFPRAPSSTQLVTRYLADPNEQTRWRAAYALTRGPADPSVVPQLIELVRNDRSGLTASFAARGLRAAAADSAGQRSAAVAALLSRI
ncbi:MAG TPA: HEAT repeat domain-containing protein, partial [Longimicrobiales bacterium]